MKTSFLRLCGLVLGSALFLPVSCTSGLVVGVRTMIELTASDISKGESPHPAFYVIASMPKGNGSLSAIHLAAIDPSFYDRTCGIGIDTSEYSFLLPNSEGEFRQDKWMQLRYSATIVSPGKQLVEVRWDGDDYRGMSRYIAEEDRVEPLYSEQWGAMHMFIAWLFGLFFAVVLRDVGKWLRKSYRPENGDNTVRG